MGRVQYHEPYEGTIIEVELVHKLGLREPPPVIVVLPRYDHNGYGGNALSGKPGGAIIVQPAGNHTGGIHNHIAGRARTVGGQGDQEGRCV